MEGSEDDAGAAISASRRPSAREKDVSLAEDGDAARHFQHETSETRASSCGTPAMSEDNFDGDSVPSPSSKDTSTEAILDMIDDFIGDPRAPRLPPPVIERSRTSPVPSTSGSFKQSYELKEQIKTPPRLPSPPASANIDIISENVTVKPAEAECTPHSEILICVNTNIIEELPQASSSVQLDSNENCSFQQSETSENVIPNMSIEQPVVAPSCISVETVRIISDASECDSLGRTVKCVTSSESRDSVTVELPESTSNECSVSESKAPSVETTASRSPLKRRLIRPVLSDRRPDSTVSSTVDSQTADIHTAEQTRSDTIAKDVSSSSDAVPNVHGIAILEEITDVSEISICKAETSTPPSKKIKLVRPKLAPVTSNSVRSEPQITSPSVERDRCQSTSSDEISLTSAKTEVETSSSITTEEREVLEKPDSVPEPDPNVSIVEQQSTQIPELPQNKVAVANDATDQGPQCTGTQEVMEPHVADTGPFQICEAQSDVLLVDTPLNDVQKETSVSILKEKDNATAIKLLAATDCVAVKDAVEPQCSKTREEQNLQSTKLIVNAACETVKVVEDSTDLQILHSEPLCQNLPSIPMDLDASKTPTLNCDQDSQKVIQEVNFETDNQKKVLPIKINLTSPNHDNKPEQTSLKISQIVEDDSTSSKAEDCKQVPKLTIKLTNKNIEEIKSPIPKLTIKPLQPPVEQNAEVMNSDRSSDHIAIEEKPNITSISIKPIHKPTEELNKSKTTPVQSGIEQDADISNTNIPNVTKINIKPILKPVEKTNEIVSKPPKPAEDVSAVDSNSVKATSSASKLSVKPTGKANKNETKDPQLPVESNTNKQILNVTKLNIKPIPKPVENVIEASKLLQPVAEHSWEEPDSNKQIPIVTKINIKAIPKPSEKLKECLLKASESAPELIVENQQIPNITKINIKPISRPSEKINDSPTKSLRPRPDQVVDDHINQQIPNITKINIKPITKPAVKDNESSSTTLQLGAVQTVENKDANLQAPSITKIKSKQSKIANDSIQQSYPETIQNDVSKKEQTPIITKLNIKPVVKPPEKINEIHRKSSSSEISESECSENDESTSTSDQASASDQGPLDAVPKLTIKLGKPGTECEGKFYTEKNVPKLTIKNVQHSEKDDQVKLVVSQSDEKQLDKVPKITIKTIMKCDSQPLSPKLTIKPIRPPENINKEEIPKLKITSETFSSSADVKENLHVPKITIKPVTKIDGDGACKTPKKPTMMCENSEHIPIVTKLNIKPILKPAECGESSESYDEKVPVVSKLNIKPVIKPKDNEVDSSIEDVPKITKLNIKPLKNPEESSSDKKDCDEKNADMKDSCIPVVTKLNIKPIVKPVEDKALKDSENQSSETGNSSDENNDHIPVVTKLNIKPVIKPSELEEITKPAHNEQPIPVITKLNIKPLIKPEDLVSPASPKKDLSKSPGSSGIPVVTKLNIKPIVKPEDLQSKTQEESIEKSSKPPLLMKINIKNVSDSASETEHMPNDVTGKAHSPKITHSPKATRRSTVLERSSEPHSKPAPAVSDEVQINKYSEISRSSPSLLQTECSSHLEQSSGINPVPENIQNSSKENLLSRPITTEVELPEQSMQELKTQRESLPISDNKINKKNAVQISEVHDKIRFAEHYNSNYSRQSILNCTLLKKLLSTTKEVEKTTEGKPTNCVSQSGSSASNCKESKLHEEGQSELLKRLSPKSERGNELKQSAESVKTRSIEEIRKEANESVTKPLEIVTDRIANQSSGQDSPRIILKINKTDQGASSKIITEDTQKITDSSPPNDSHACEIVQSVNDSPSPKKLVNSRRKTATAELAANMTMGKRLRSSRIVESSEKSPAVKRNVNKRPPAADSPSLLQQKETEPSILESKRMKLEQLLSANKSLTITPVTKVPQTSPSRSSISSNQGAKITHNHSLLNNESSQKNGNSKLQNILSNLQAKQLQTLQMNDTSVSEKPSEIVEVESSVSTGSSDVVVEITRVENCHLDVQEMMINENSVCDLTEPEEVSQDPLEVESMNTTPEVPKEPAVQAVEMTPTPRKRGRPRKTPLAASLMESDKSSTPVSVPVPLPATALEERPQRSLRLMREKPPILRKPRGRGRGRGRGGRRGATPPAPSPGPEPEIEPEPEAVVVVEVAETRAESPIDPTSSRIKLPRMTEALDKSVAGASCATPLSSRRRSSSSQTDLKLFSSASVVLDSPQKGEEFMKTPEAARPKSGRGSRGGRGRTPRGRGRGRGGGRGAMYMKETMGIYGRVCGPATTTVQLFEEETCMMDDNATPSKPSHLLDEDSQSSVKSSTNDSNKMKKSKFADLFDSNKIWTAADVKEYTWPPADTPNAEPQVMMIQEQVAMFLGVKSFKRRYPELKRRTVGGEERDFVLAKGIVTEALCDLGITAVDASEVLDIMLSDYPHKYEEYRTHQREKQMTLPEETVEVKVEEKLTKVEIKAEKSSDKPEPPKVDPEKTRQDMAAAAIASAAEWNARANAWRRPACVDLQSNTIHRRRAPPAPPQLRVRPPHGYYPHALLPGQYQHWYRTYTPEQLRYFPLNTALAAPPAPPSPADSSSESEGSWGDNSSSSEDSDAPHHHSAKRKKLSRVKRSSQQDKEESRGGASGDVDTCRVCKLRLEANRKHTHERFLVCANCNAKLHPLCVELPADTIRKCRSYAWQCAECKSCCACRRPQDDDKMLFCDLCDRGFHIYCVGLTTVPSGRWHCVECAICKSCGARDPNGLTPAAGTPGPSSSGLSTPGLSTPGPSTPGSSNQGVSTPATPGLSSGEWHHQTRRGPGGHKVYSHSLCTPCARAYRIGRYCPLCERSFIGPKGTMQLVICKLCDRQLHQECVRQTTSTLRVLDYTCAECRRGGITSRSAAVRAAPRTIATLFMAKRRFNKYAHKQYLASRLQAIQDAADADAEPMPPTDDDASRDLADPLEGVGDDTSTAPPDD